MPPFPADRFEKSNPHPGCETSQATPAEQIQFQTQKPASRMQQDADKLASCMAKALKGTETATRGYELGPPANTDPLGNQSKAQAALFSSSTPDNDRSSSGTAKARSKTVSTGIVRRRRTAAAHPPPAHPMPKRMMPVIFNGRHEINPNSDLDWTLCGEDMAKEYRLREQRNQMIKDELLASKYAVFRSGGYSLESIGSKNNDCTEYHPVTKDEEINERDVVFCQVQPTNRFYGHLVLSKTIWKGNGRTCYCIGNAEGRPNGWCHIEHIYGRLAEWWS